MDELQSKIKAEYLDGSGPTALSKKYGVSVDTIKSWIKRQRWRRGEGAPSDQQGAPRNAEKVHPEERSTSPPDEKQKRTRHIKQTRRGAPDGNQNAKGNSGGGAPEGNGNAVTHGFFRRFLPDDKETREILDEIGRMTTADMLWTSIEFKMTAIVRGQKVMFVRDQDDMTRVLKRQKVQLVEVGKGEDKNVLEMPVEQEWELQMPWDKYATYLTAQARAMSELRSLIKQFEELADEKDERLLKIQQHKQTLHLERERHALERERFEWQKEVDNAKLDIAMFKALPPSDEDDEPTESDGYAEAMGGMTAQEVWSDDDTTPKS